MIIFEQQGQRLWSHSYLIFELVTYCFTSLYTTFTGTVRFCRWGRLTQQHHTRFPPRCLCYSYQPVTADAAADESTCLSEQSDSHRESLYHGGHSVADLRISCALIHPSHYLSSSHKPRCNVSILYIQLYFRRKSKFLMKIKYKTTSNLLYAVQNVASDELAELQKLMQ